MTIYKLTHYRDSRKMSKKKIYSIKNHTHKSESLRAQRSNLLPKVLCRKDCFPTLRFGQALFASLIPRNNFPLRFVCLWRRTFSKVSYYILPVAAIAFISALASTAAAQNTGTPTDGIFSIENFVFNGGFTDCTDSAANLVVMGNLGQNIIFETGGEDSDAQGFWYLWTLTASGNDKGVLPITPDITQIDTLYQNYPNPFNPVTYIPFSISGQLHQRRNVRVTIALTNELGQHVKTVVAGDYSAGGYGVLFNGRELTSGLYIITMDVDDPASIRPHFECSKKMLFMR